MKKPVISILLVIRNNKNWLKYLLPHLIESNTLITIEIVAVVSNSTDGSLSILKSYSDLIFIEILNEKEKISFVHANNQAAKNASGKYLVVIKPGVKPLGNWLHYLLLIAENEKKIGIVGSRIIYDKSCFSFLFWKLTSQSRYCTYHNDILLSDEKFYFNPAGTCDHSLTNEDLPFTYRSIITSSCFLIEKSTYLENGGLDESYGLSGGLVDLCLRLYYQGYKNKYSPNSTYVHYFFPISKKRHVDADFFEFSRLQNKWFHKLKRSFWEEKIRGGSHQFSNSSLVVAIAVTDHGDGVTAGDYFTAQELAYAMKAHGWKVTYLSRKKKEWYKIPEDVDIILNLLDAYDLDKIPVRKKRLLKVAWARNWFDKWCDMPSFNDYDIVFSSSQKSCQYINDNSRQSACLLPIASNPHRFMAPTKHLDLSVFKSDICFTGSYWDYPRDIVEGVSQEVLDKYNFSIYGAHWDKVDKFAKFSKGFIDYTNIPCVYQQTKIVIDDANHVTKPFGSVNSRVFDAIMSDALVITNGVEGSKELFSGELPYYEDQNELTRLLEYYLENEDERKAKVQYLKKIVLTKHTYSQRAISFKLALEDRLLKYSIAIKIPAPSWDVAPDWGDYHLAVSLKQALEKENFRVILQVLPEWDNEKGYECDAVIVLRGLSRYTLKTHQLNILWNISHPDKVSLEEYEEYDQVYIASKLWADEISRQVSVPVETMLQCTNPEVFLVPTEEERELYKTQLLYVGNSRKVYRKLLKDLLPTFYDLSVYGKNWEELIPNEYIKANHIPNEQLYKYYGTAKILLNDHWDDMREKGFISNRIFDGLASGALIITDRVSAMGDLEGYVKTYDSPDDLVEIIEECLAWPEKYRNLAYLGRKQVLENHTFQHRASEFGKYIQSELNFEKL